MTGWQRFADGPCPLDLYWARDAAEPDAAPWPVHVPCGLFVDRPATHWHAPVSPALPEGAR